MRVDRVFFLPLTLSSCFFLHSPPYPNPNPSLPTSPPPPSLSRVFLLRLPCIPTIRHLTHSRRSGYMLHISLLTGWRGTHATLISSICSFYLQQWSHQGKAKREVAVPLTRKQLASPQVPAKMTKGICALTDLCCAKLRELSSFPIHTHPKHSPHPNSLALTPAPSSLPLSGSERSTHSALLSQSSTEGGRLTMCRGQCKLVFMPCLF